MNATAGAPSQVTARSNPELTPITGAHPVIYAHWGSAVVLGAVSPHHWATMQDFHFSGKYTQPEDFLSAQLAAEQEGFRNWIESPLVRGGERYKMFRCRQGVCVPEGEMTGQRATLFIPPINGEYQFTVDMPAIPDERGTLCIGVAADSELVPRNVRRRGKAGVEVDVDGDGHAEAFEIHEKRAKSGKTLGLTMRGKSGTRTVAEALLDGIYAAEWNYGLLDLDGDGQFELITVEEGHNTSVAVRALKATAEKPLLRWYNGD